MSNFWWQDAWLLLAIKYTQGTKEFAHKDEVIKWGDYINHAIFTEEEIIQFLSPIGLFEVFDDNFKLGNSFEVLWTNSGAEKYKTFIKQLDILQKSLVDK
jgi:hypothetical protein